MPYTADDMLTMVLFTRLNAGGHPPELIDQTWGDTNALFVMSTMQPEPGEFTPNEAVKSWAAACGFALRYDEDGDLYSPQRIDELDIKNEVTDLDAAAAAANLGMDMALLPDRLVEERVAGGGGPPRRWYAVQGLGK